MPHTTSEEVRVRMRRKRAGQSTAEYAVLFAIVIGAAIAMQQYVKSRLQGAMAFRANNYLTISGGAVFEPNRTVNTSSNASSGMTMQSAHQGTININSNSNTNSITTK